MTGFRKPTGEFIRIVLSLLVIAAAIAVLVGITDSLTRGKIAENQKKTFIEAQERLFAGAEFTLVKEIEGDVRSIYLANGTNDADDGDENVALGYAVNVTVTGRNGDIELMVGIDVDGAVKKVIVLSSQENAAGANIRGDAFLDQFIGKTIGVALGGGENDVEAVTTGTISSKAVVKGVGAALDAVRQLGDETQDDSDDSIDGIPVQPEQLLPSDDPSITGGDAA